MTAARLSQKLLAVVAGAAWLSACSPAGLLNATISRAGLTVEHDIAYGPHPREKLDVYWQAGAAAAPVVVFFYGGAWNSGIVPESKLLGTKPVIINVCNFTKPAPGQPALISFNNVTTMFHEFGHALHGMFTNLTYPTLAGNVARDFVEFPSQFNEHWALDPNILKHYAVHYQTGASIPQTLIDKIKRASGFNQGYEAAEAMEGSLLDMQWHKLAPGKTINDVDKFEKDALHTTGLDLPQVPPRYRSTYFQHIFSGGYAAGYYSYQWTKMLAESAFAWFEQHGGLTRANGQRFRDMVLSRGSSMDYNTMFKNFSGHAPDIKPYKKALGVPD